MFLLPNVFGPFAKCSPALGWSPVPEMPPCPRATVFTSPMTNGDRRQMTAVREYGVMISTAPCTVHAHLLPCIRLEALSAGPVLVTVVAVPPVCTVEPTE